MKTAKLDGKNGFNDQRIYREKLIQPLWLFSYCTDAKLCNRLHWSFEWIQPGHDDIQHSDAQLNDTHHNNIQHKNIQHTNK